VVDARPRREAVLPSTACSEAISSAAAASEIWLTHRGGEPAALAAGSSASGSSPGGVAARALVVADVAEGTISRSKRPSSIARIARWWDSSANASMSSRVMSHFSAIISAPRNWLTSWSP
jgi:hypothetical protein